MPIYDNIDVDALISRLASPLSPPAREAFRRAAEDALAHVSCLGEGVAFRILAALQRDFFDPPDDSRAAWDIAREPRASKLKKAAPIGRDDCRASGRVRTLLTR